jgi:hypothetical protein
VVIDFTVYSGIYNCRTHSWSCSPSYHTRELWSSLGQLLPSHPCCSPFTDLLFRLHQCTTYLLSYTTISILQYSFHQLHTGWTCCFCSNNIYSILISSSLLNISHLIHLPFASVPPAASYIFTHYITLTCCVCHSPSNPTSLLLYISHLSFDFHLA